MSKELGSKIGRDLIDLAQLLRKTKLCKDTSSIDAAGNTCMSKATPDKWSYQLKPIVFEIPEPEIKRMPEDAVDLTASLTVFVEGQPTEDKKIKNPLTNLLFNIEIQASRLNEKTETVDQLYAAWHLDKHIVNRLEEEPTYSHPLYHFAFGGHRMKAKGTDYYGGAIILDSPRFIYPPMDAVLGIDFILQNYFPKERISRLVADPEYIRIRRYSQNMLWKPFYTSLFSHWQPDVCAVEDSFAPHKLFPLYC